MIKDKFLKLVDAYKDDKDMLEFISDATGRFPKYVEVVVNMEYRIPILRHRLEPEAYRNAVMNLDNNRRMAHDTAIGACRQLNRMSKAAGLEPFYLGDEDSREEVAAFACQVTNEFFAHGTNKNRNLDSYVKERPRIDTEKSIDDIIAECKIQDDNLFEHGHIEDFDFYH